MVKARNVERAAKPGAGTQPGRSVLVDTVPAVIQLCKTMHALPKGSLAVCDTECDNLFRVFNNRLLAIQFCHDGHTGYVIPFDHPQSPFNADDKQTIANTMKWMFTEPTPNSIFWGFHHNQYDLHQIRRTFETEVISSHNIDSEQLAYLLNENRIKGARDPDCYYQGEKGLSMATLARVYLDMELDADDKKDRANIIRWSMERFVEYAGKDTWVPWRIIQEEMREARADGYIKPLMRLVKYLFSPANLLVCEMETNGFYLDLEHILRIKGAGSPLIVEKKRLMEKLQKLRGAQKANDRIVEKASRGNRVLFGDTTWRLNPGKDAHRRTLFYDVLEYDPISFTDADPPKPKVDTEFYEEYGIWEGDDKEPMNEAAICGDWTGVNKMLTSFIKNFHKLIDPDAGNPDMQPDGRVRTTVKLSATTTGRQAAEKPAMHQIPRDTNDWRKAVKRMFAVEPGNVLICADLKANEVRWGAINAGCKDLGRLFKDGVSAQKGFRRVANRLAGEDKTLYVRCLAIRKAAKYDDNGKAKNGEAKELESIKKTNARVRRVLWMEKDATLRGDIHVQTASQFYDLPLDKVPKDKRQDTKSIIFGHIAARGVKAISEQVKKTKEATQKLLNEFDQRFPDLAQYLQQCRVDARRKGYVEGPQGRRRRFSGEIWNGQEEWIQAKALRQAQNNTIQGVASDACLVAGIVLLDWIREHDKGFRVLNIVHDSVMMEVPIEEMLEAIDAVEWALTTGTMAYMTKHFGVDFTTPLEAEVDAGPSWGDTQVWNGSAPHAEAIHQWVVAMELERRGV